MRQWLLSLLDHDRSSVQQINALRAGVRASGRRRTASYRDANERSALVDRDQPPTPPRASSGRTCSTSNCAARSRSTRGSIAEMQTGEGKTLAAVPAISWFARERQAFT